MIKTKSIVTMSILRSCVLLLMMAFSAVTSAQGVLSGAQTGTLEEIHESDNYMVISGRKYDFHNDVTHVFYDGEEVRTHFLNEGLVIRFVLNRDRVISTIEVLGPENLIEALVES